MIYYRSSRSAGWTSNSRIEKSMSCALGTRPVPGRGSSRDTPGRTGLYHRPDDLRTLEGKRYVSHEQEGRGHRYFATVKQRAAQRSALRHLTRKLFKGSAELLFIHLVSDQKLSAKQIRNLRELLESKSDTGET